MNPKASTVEELKGRRKALHMGMCKLLREDMLLKLKSVFEVCALRIRYTNFLPSRYRILVLLDEYAHRFVLHCRLRLRALIK